MQNIPRNVAAKEVDGCLVGPKGAVALELKNLEIATTPKGPKPVEIRKR
jgi:hypothetical protein